MRMQGPSKKSGRSRVTDLAMLSATQRVRSVLDGNTEDDRELKFPYRISIAEVRRPVIRFRSANETRVGDLAPKLFRCVA